MVYEDFTAFTEVDPNSRFVATASRITFTGLQRDETAYVYKDKGVDFFDGDFEHQFNVHITAGSGASPNALNEVWALGNVLDDRKGIQDGGGDLLPPPSTV